jgi:hypothetical protein
LSSAHPSSKTKGKGQEQVKRSWLAMHLPYFLFFLAIISFLGFEKNVLLAGSFAADSIPLPFSFSNRKQFCRSFSPVQLHSQDLQAQVKSDCSELKYKTADFGARQRFKRAHRVLETL